MNIKKIKLSISYNYYYRNMDIVMNSTMTWSSNLTSTNIESGDKFNRRIPDHVTNNLVCGVMISIIFLWTTCFFCVFRSIYASGGSGTLTVPNHVRFGRSANVPIERHVVPNNTINSSSHLKCPENSMLHHPDEATISNTSRNDHSSTCFAYKLQMRLEKITPV